MSHAYGLNTMPSPLPKATELAERLRRMVTAPSIDELALQRIAVEANKLLAVDAGNAHAVLGAVAALRWNPEEAERCHRHAIALGDPVVEHCNYAVSLTLLGQVDEAFDALQAAFDRAPDNLTMLRHLVEAAISAAHFGHALALLATWDKLSPASAMPHRGIIEALTKAMASGHFSENGARGILRVAASVRRDHRVPLVRMGIKPAVSEPGTFFANMDITGSSTKAADLNEALADRWADSPDLMDDPGLRFVPMFFGDSPDGHHG